MDAAGGALGAVMSTGFCLQSCFQQSRVETQRGQGGAFGASPEGLAVPV